MRRGDLVIAAAPGDYGKPRPHRSAQAHAKAAPVDSVLLCALSTHLRSAPFLVAVAPTSANGLRDTSEVLIDKIVSLPRAKIGAVIGRLDEETLERVHGALMLVLGLGATLARSPR